MKKSVFLSIGELFISRDPVQVWTVLGSCVSVVLYSRKSKIGAICHAQLPSKDFHGDDCRANCPNPCYRRAPNSNDFKYVSCSVNYMINKMKDLGASSNDMYAAVFGGSNVFNIMNDGKSVGQKNAEIAIDILNAHKIKVLRTDLGGKGSRKIVFNTYTGEVDMKFQQTNLP